MSTARPTIGVLLCRIGLREGLSPLVAVRVALRAMRPLCRAPLGWHYRGRYDVAVLRRYLRLLRAARWAACDELMEEGRCASRGSR